MRGPPRAKDSVPWTKARTSRATGRWASRGQGWPAEEQQWDADGDERAGMPVGQASGGGDADEGTAAEEHQCHGNPQFVRPGAVGDDGRETGEGGEGTGVDERAEQHGQEQRPT